MVVARVQGTDHLYLPWILVEQGKNNIAFSALYELGELEQVIDLLIKTDRIPEAAVFARTYAPQQMSKIVKLWKANLENQNKKKVAESLADPADYPNLFPDMQKVRATCQRQEESITFANQPLSNTVQ